MPCICIADVAHSSGLAFWGVVISGCLSPSQQRQLPSVVIWAGVHVKCWVQGTGYITSSGMCAETTSFHMGFCATQPPQATALQGGEDFSVA